LKSSLSHLENIGTAYTPSEDIQRWYQLIPLSQVRIPGTDITMQDSTSSSDEGDERNLAEAEGLGQSDDQDESEEKSHTNVIVNHIDVLGRVSFVSLLENLELIYFTSFWTVFSSTLSIAEISYSIRMV
jgi:hypothetical protein